MYNGIKISTEDFNHLNDEVDLETKNIKRCFIFSMYL